MEFFLLGSLTAAYFGKKYFNGGVCNLNKDLQGKVIIITGASSGIGKETAIQLLKRNATVVLGCRNLQKAQVLFEQLQKQYGTNKCVFIQIDLQNPNSINNFVDKFKTQFNKLDILINNAGIIGKDQRELTQNGLETTFATNHIGHIMLQSLLMDIINKTSQSRIINISSMYIHKVGKNNKLPILNFEDLQFDQNYNSGTAYVKSKLVNYMYSLELAKRFERKKIQTKIFSCHPGVVRTEGLINLVFKNTFVKFLTYPLLWYFTKSPIQGTQTILYLCQEQFEILQNGEYYVDCQIGGSSKKLIKDFDCEKIFNISENLVKKINQKKQN